MAGSKADLIDKRGKKLSAISFGIIVFIIAGGSFNKTGSFMGGGISFEHPYLLKYFILIVFAYYFYKYWLLYPKPLSIFFSIITTKTRTSDYLKAYIREKSRPIIRSKIEQGEKILGKVWDTNDNGKPIVANVTNHSDAKPFIIRDGTNYLVKASLANAGNSQVIYDNNKYTVFKISISRYYYYYMIVLLKFIIFNDRFSKEFYPYILSVIAFAFLCYEILIKI